MKTTAPPTYAPMLAAMRATALGSVLARLYPERPRPSLAQLAEMADAHQARMARAARELQASPAVAAAARAKRLRQSENAMAGLLPTATRKAV